MKIIRASELGMCFGVRDALKIVDRVDEPRLVTIHGELVHNEHVNQQLTQLGFHQSSEDDRDPIPDTPNVLITAHGVSDKERKRLLSAGKQLIDTTCPLVRRVHKGAMELRDEGRHVLVVGKAGHVEVRGIIEDLSSFSVIERTRDVETYPFDRLGVVSQTTMPPDIFTDIRDCVEIRNPNADIRVIDTVCDPTKRRQLAISELVGRVDAVVVVGGRNSNNTRRLVELCRERGKRACHVEGADQLEPDWFEGARLVGLTAGTSTLDKTTKEVYQRLLEIADRMDHGSC